MDETVVNGAQLFYKEQFGIDSESSRDTWLVGLLNSAPYLCCAVAGCCACRRFPIGVHFPALTM